MSILRMDWGALYYEHRIGSEPPLVLLHGTGCDIRDWDQTIRAMPEERSLVSIDLRGHGCSDVPTEPFTLEDLAGDTLHLLEHLGYDRYWLVGHSLGGMVAMAAARRSPAVRGLVLLEGWTRLSVVRSAFDETHMYGGLPTGDVRCIQEKAVRTKARFAQQTWASFWRSVECFDASLYLDQATIPIVQVYGSGGRHAGARGKLEVPWRENIEWIWLEGAGHYLAHERPQSVAEICLAE